MGSRNFRLLLLLRIGGIILTTGLAIYCMFVLKNTIRSVFSIVLLVILAADFWFFLGKIHADIRLFLTALLNNDFSIYQAGTGKSRSVAGIYDLFHKLSVKYHKISTEKEVQHIFLQTLVEQVDIGILCFEEDGTIFLVNRAFKDLVLTVPLLNISRLEEKHPELHAEFNRIRSGERRLVKYFSKGEIIQVSLICSEFSLLGKGYKLVSVQNIGKELDEKEIESWQKLIRVLTHEIMNSVTPITSLTNSLFERVRTEREEHQSLSPVTVNFLEEGLEAIANRSRGLIGFTQAFHNLLRIPMPVIEPVETKQFFERIALLLQPLFREHGIRFTSQIDHGAARIYADAPLLEQAVINLLKNAVESLSATANPVISLQAVTQLNGRTQIIVSDNGCGIPVIHFDKIFVPFYTTKEKGTGIGLSLSRQIVQLHRGTLSVKSIPNVETSFVIEIP
jgi:two-component system nitrogen regulation sensor histidine kinase NtrY